MSDLIEKKEVLNAIRACAMSEEISPKIIYQTVSQMTPAPSIPIDWIQQKMYALGVSCDPSKEMIASVLDSLIRAYREENNELD